MEIKIGKLELTNTEIKIKTLTKKKTIPLTQLRTIKYNEPGRLKGGNMILTPYYDNPIVVSIAKKHKEDARQVYNYLSSITEQNQPPIHELEQDPTLNTFECQIKEEKQTTFSGTQTYTQKATVKLYDDKITISKSGVFTSLDKGTKTVLFQDVTSLDMDMSTMFTFVILTMAGSPGVVLQHINGPVIQKFYDLLDYKINKFKSANNTSTGNVGNVSDADELERWHSLMEKGVITPEEFEVKKKELLGLWELE